MLPRLFGAAPARFLALEIVTYPALMRFAYALLPQSLCGTPSLRTYPGRVCLPHHRRLLTMCQISRNTLSTYQCSYICLYILNKKTSPWIAPSSVPLPGAYVPNMDDLVFDNPRNNPTRQQHLINQSQCSTGSLRHNIA
ncbi:uncharacterized protein EI90DRAFT_543025 [Cantharellus anzutake]|uniref:uncharacterized protein n=1 Tax=Cantharellus anzutake TaxID=1750568 RepID=UPI001904FBD8|nr:uncharacterized protein EI90DRAFT_543025 [Cantharellus anzutake]KAF8313754.1 hypothetical protein EI90DRAFT_543025 [Cantharellus anzutake]